MQALTRRDSGIGRAWRTPQRIRRCTATAGSIARLGAKPVFADVRPDTWTVDPRAVEAAITERTVGIIAVDTLGQPADYAELEALAAKRRLWLVEDAACGSGTTSSESACAWQPSITEAGNGQGWDAR